MQGIRRRLRRLWGGGGGPAILMYHRIAVAPYDPWNLAVAPKRFERQVAWLERNRAVLPLAEFADLHRAGRLPRRAIALTFDDGYACNAEVAAPILERLSVPATIFLTTGALAEPTEFWWDRLEHIVGCAPAGPFVVDIGGERRSWDLDGNGGMRPGGPREAAYLDLWRTLRTWPGELRALWMEALASRIGAPPAPRSSHRAMTAAQARALAASPQITLAAHSVEHPALNGISPEARRREIAFSCAVCAELTGAETELFAYPYGEYDDATVEAVRRAGVVTAVTTDEALVTPSCDSLRLPRLQVGNWSAAQLADALAR